MSRAFLIGVVAAFALIVVVAAFVLACTTRDTAVPASSTQGAAPAALWTPHPAAFQVSGSGQDVQFVHLREDVYAVTVLVDGNRNAWGRAADFVVTISGDRGREVVADETEASWAGSSLLTVGHASSDDLPPGEAAVEVAAAGQWSVVFEPASRLAQPAAAGAVSGGGRDTRFVMLGEGRYVVTAAVDGNSERSRPTNFIVAISGGRLSAHIANEIADSWTGSSLLRVGEAPGSDLAPGMAAVEVRATGDWTISFEPRPAAAPPAEASALRGSGRDVRFVDLEEGRYVVTAGVEGNGARFGPGHFFVVIFGERRRAFIVNEAADSWEGSSLLRVGDTSSDDVPPGVAAVEVRASGDWTVEFEPRQTSRRDATQP
jgi:hypothetical protein